MVKDLIDIQQLTNFSFFFKLCECTERNEKEVYTWCRARVSRDLRRVLKLRPFYITINKYKI